MSSTPAIALVSDDDLNTAEMVVSADAFNRGRGVEYTGALSDALSSELESFCVASDQVFDITKEIGLARMFLARDLKDYSKLDAFKPADADGLQSKKVALEALRSRVEYSTDRVAALVDKGSAIRARRNGRVDHIIMASVAGRVARSLDRAISAIAPSLDAAGVDVGMMAEVIAEELNAEAYAEARLIDGQVVEQVSDQPAEITAEEIMQAMAESVPLTDAESA